MFEFTFRHQDLDILSQLTVLFGGYWEYVVVVGLIGYVLALRSGRPARRVRAHIAAGAMVAASVARFGVVELIRLFYDRPRPFVDSFVPLIAHDPSESFPSGHATFFMALAIYFLLSKQKKMGVFLLVSAFLISFGRVAAGIHYWSDVLAGWGIGAAVAVIIWYVHLRWIRRRSLTTVEK